MGEFNLVSICSFAYAIIVENPERKTLLRGPKRRSVDNIKMDLGDIELGSMNWIILAQDRDR
jgi:hypothetical protein